jgi:hypothetical protein
MKSLSVLFIQRQLLIFEISLLNIPLLKSEVIPATRFRRVKPTGTSHTRLPNFSCSLMKSKIKLCSLGIIRSPMLFTSETETISRSSISRDYISLQALCQIFVNRPARLESSISRSLASDCHIHFIYLICHTALMLLTFISFRVLHGIMIHDQFKRVIKVSAVDLRWAFCGEPKFSFNHDRRSTSFFKIFSSSQKVNSLHSTADRT